MAVDWDKPIQCCYDGELKPARYLGTIKVKHTFDRHLVAVDHGDFESVVWTSDSGDTCGSRIVTNVPQRHVRWMNLYGGNYRIGGLYGSREEADRGAVGPRTACIRFEFEEGEGL